MSESGVSGAGRRDSAPAPPEGFKPHGHSSPLTDPWEPIYRGWSPLGYASLGLYLRTEHTNRRGMAHGGLIASVADNAMGMASHIETLKKGFPPPSLVTSSLQVDYFGRAQLGQWLLFEPSFIRIGRVLTVANLMVTADGKSVAKASATFTSG